MKIAMFTPAIRSSAIGRMASLVTREWVANGVLVVVVRTEAACYVEVPTHDFGVAPLHWTDTGLVEAALAGVDMIVHQVGNSYEYHEGNLHWIHAAPGVVSLHDFYLGHLFFGWASRQPDPAKRELARWYGPSAAEAFFAHAGNRDFIELTCETMPMTEWMASKALAVVTHSAWGINRVLDACVGPVSTLPLPYDANLPATDVPVRGASDDLTLLTVGHVNANKRIEQVIRAIGSSELLKTKIVYRVIGRVEPSMSLHLSELARQFGVRLTMVGEVEDEVLADALAQADVVSCLRWPSLESASASAIEAMLHGKPVLVTDTGFYSELPDDHVIKIAAPGDEASICAALEYLCENPSVAHELGQRAMHWARRTFSAARYASGLQSLAIPVRQAGLLRKAVSPSERFLAAWGGGMHWLDTPSITDGLDIIGAENLSSD